MEKKPHRPLSDIAAEIGRDWKKIYFGAVPYLDAMATLDQVSDAYGCDSGQSIVQYFLANANSWRGEVARRVKAELKELVQVSDPTESMRRALVEEINSNAGERQALEAKYGQVWDTTQLQVDFAVQAFLAPFVICIRKADGARGTLEFQHHPRYYFNFVAE